MISMFGLKSFKCLNESAEALDIAGYHEAADAIDAACTRLAQQAPYHMNMPPSSRMIPWSEIGRDIADVEDELNKHPRIRPDPAHGVDTGDDEADFGQEDPEYPPGVAKDKTQESPTIFNMDDKDPKKGGSPFHMHSEGALGFSYVTPDFQSPSMKGDGFSWTELRQHTNPYSPRM